MTEVPIKPTPGTVRLCEVVGAAIARARAGFPRRKPATIYLTAEDASAAGFRWQHFAKADPPRCHGLPVRIILGRGSSRLYCQGGSAIGIARELHQKEPEPC